MLQEYVFRYVTVRPGDQHKARERAPRKTRVYDPKKPTEFGATLARLRAAKAGDEEVLRVVRAYQASPQYVKTLEGLPFDVEKGLAWITENAGRKAGEIDLGQALKDLYGAAPPDLLKSRDFQATLERISDSLVAEAIRGAGEEASDRLTAARKLLALVERAAAGVKFDPEMRLGAAFAGLSAIIPNVAPRYEPPKTAPPPPPPTREDEREREQMRKRLAELEQSHRELSRRLVDEETLESVNPRRPEGDRLRELERRVGAVESTRSRALADLARPDMDEAMRARLAQLALPQGGTTGEGTGARMVMKAAAIEDLSEVTRKVVADARLDLRKFEPTRVVSFIEEEMQLLSAKLASAEAPQTMIMLGGVTLDSKKLKEALFGGASPAGLLKDHCKFQAGVGDLLMVKQNLKAYELAEFAHVENVLAGESREREHRRLNVREEIFVSEEERETEKERNLQSTERNEMQAEAEKTVKSQFELDAGLQVSGSYGPVISFTASLNVGYSTSTEETQRKAVSYSKEVTEKTSERVRERVKQETRRRLLEQVEELNRHSIVNTPATNGHVRGIYRWLNKVYDAQILNYGQRMMFEFVVPEPAAYLLYALVENPPADNELIKPTPPNYYGAPLKPSHLTRTNYLDWVAKHQVRNCPEPPPEFQHVSYFDKQDKVQDGTTFGRAGKVEVPVGYKAYAATVMSDYTFTDGEGHSFHVMVGGVSFDVSSYWGSDYKAITDRNKEVGIAYHLWRCWSFALAIEVHCRLTAEGLAKWQQQVFDAIMESYLQQKSDYDEAVAARQIQQGVKVLGRNPMENRRIEREELKKLVLMMLTRSNNIAKNSILPGYEPNIDLQKACANGAYIRFFENAFEWNNLLYVLYPYFWGRKSRWISALHFTDPDLDFAAFLKAGAARVQVPVRPGFEKAVAHYLQFGDIWEGNDPPLYDDDLYVPIIDEIAANLGKIEDGVPYPEDAEPWEVRIPTSLVLVQNLEEIPGVRDALTGELVTVTPTS